MKEKMKDQIRQWFIECQSVSTAAADPTFCTPPLLTPLSLGQLPPHHAPTCSLWRDGPPLHQLPLLPNTLGLDPEPHDKDHLHTCLPISLREEKVPGQNRERTVNGPFQSKPPMRSTSPVSFPLSIYPSSHPANHSLSAPIHLSISLFSSSSTHPSLHPPIYLSTHLSL